MYHNESGILIKGVFIDLIYINFVNQSIWNEKLSILDYFFCKNTIFDFRANVNRGKIGDSLNSVGYSWRRRRCTVTVHLIE